MNKCKKIALTGLLFGLFCLDLNAYYGDYKYKGNSGTKYKYDLSRPEDRRAYERDFMAQQNDKMKDWQWGVQRDRDDGQFGGGIQ